MTEAEPISNLGRSLQDATEGENLATGIVSYFVFGVFIILGLVFIMYILAILFDKVLPCSRRFDQTIFDARLTEGSSVLARDAGLLGLTPEERRAILEKIFVGKPYTKELAGSVEEARLRLNSATATTTKTSADAKKTNTEDSKNNVVLDSGNQEETKTQDSSMKKKDDDLETTTTTTDAKMAANENLPVLTEASTADTTAACLICLNSYEDGEDVLVGRSCHHMFHRSCLLEWLEKKDICPCCRAPLMTATQMKKAASQVLSSERALELSLLAGLYFLANLNNNSHNAAAIAMAAAGGGGSGGSGDNETSNTADHAPTRTNDIEMGSTGTTALDP